MNSSRSNHINKDYCGILETFTEWRVDLCARAVMLYNLDVCFKEDAKKILIALFTMKTMRTIMLGMYLSIVRCLCEPDL